MDELVKSIDALSREQAVALLVRLGLDGVQVPLLLPGAKRSLVPLAPSLSAEDRAVVENLSKLINFFTQVRVRVLARGRSGGPTTGGEGTPCVHLCVCVPRGACHRHVLLVMMDSNWYVGERLHLPLIAPHLPTPEHASRPSHSH